MTAETARKIATQIKSGKIPVVLRRIKDAAMQGEYDIYVDDALNENEIDVLKRLGYTVSIKDGNRNDLIQKISWS